MLVAARPLVLASASPARLRLLRDAGLDPLVLVSGVDEAAVERDDPQELVAELAARKAGAVAEKAPPEALVVGCDSLLVLDGTAFGKPASDEDALRLWQSLRGRDGLLATGHCVFDTATGRTAAAVATTVVRFGCPTDDELAAYVGSGEPMHVAGGFTLDGRSAPFLRGVDGDAGNVIGLSLPLLRDLLARLDVRITDLWC